MNPKRVTFALFLALMVSGFCSWFVASKLNRHPAQQHAPDAMYVAPSRPMQAGEILKADNVELVAWPSSNPVDGAFKNSADLLGREVLFPLSKGQPIIDRDISAAGSGTGLAGKIPDGMRAIALKSDEVVGVAGFLVPGSHLDVLVTYRSANSPEPVTASVLQNAVVIAAGHQTEPDAKGEAATATVVTLLLTPQQAERAVLASTQGAIHFVLRNGADTTTINDVPVQMSQLSGQPVVSTASSGSRPVRLTTHTQAAPQTHEIETVLGGTEPGNGTSQGGQK